jgi:hypothetical protein
MAHKTNLQKNDPSLFAITLVLFSCHLAMPGGFWCLRFLLQPAYPLPRLGAHWAQARQTIGWLAGEGIMRTPLRTVRPASRLG